MSLENSILNFKGNETICRNLITSNTGGRDP